MDDLTAMRGAEGRTLDDYLILDLEAESPADDADTEFHFTWFGEDDEAVVDAVAEAVADGDVVSVDAIEHSGVDDVVSLLHRKVTGVGGTLVQIGSDQLLAYDPDVIQSVVPMDGDEESNATRSNGDAESTAVTETQVFDAASGSDSAETEVFDAASESDSAETEVFDDGESTSDDETETRVFDGASEMNGTEAEDAESDDTQTRDDAARPDDSSDDVTVGFCPGCGADLDDYDRDPRFCPRCGEDLTEY